MALSDFIYAIILAVLLLFMILNSHQMSPNFLVFFFFNHGIHFCMSLREFLYETEEIFFLGAMLLKLWLVLGVFLMATSLRMYATCQQLQAQAQAHAAAASGLLGHTELRLHVPQSIAFATRGRLQSLRLQLALLDREFDDLGMA